MRLARLTILAGALILAAPTAWAASTARISILTPNIDYPGAGITGTRASGINNAGNVDFNVFTSTSQELGYRPNGGAFIPPAVDPNASTFTQADQINNANTIAGGYQDSTTLAFHGFQYSAGTFTTYDVPVTGAFNTVLFGINDQGDIAGEYEIGPSTFAIKGFAVIAGVLTPISVPGSVGGFAAAINNSDVIAGAYSKTDPLLQESTCACHGFVRTAAGSIHSFDPTGSVSTIPHGINSKNTVVGRYYDSTGNVHGFAYFASTNKIISYDYPGALQTSLNGINDNNIIAARYTDSGNVAHGFIAKLIP